jgi:hypothetical protein
MKKIGLFFLFFVAANFSFSQVDAQFIRLGYTLYAFDIGIEPNDPNFPTNYRWKTTFPNGADPSADEYGTPNISNPNHDNMGSIGDFGGFDYNGDGVIDAGMQMRRLVTPTAYCNNNPNTAPLEETWLEVVDGLTGTRIPITSPMTNRCFTSVAYQNIQLAPPNLFFGTTAGLLTVIPQYDITGTFLEWQPNGFTNVGTFFNSTRFHDMCPLLPACFCPYNAYSNASTLSDGNNICLDNGAVQNGMMVRVGTEERLIYFPEERIIQYKVESYGANQLIFDHPYISRFNGVGPANLAGRNYGLLAKDPYFEGNIALLSGAPVYSVFADLISNQLSNDPNGEIERHVTVYNYVTNLHTDKFISTIHDCGDDPPFYYDCRYSGRLVYPKFPFLKTYSQGSTSTPSRLAYSVYDQGHWYLNITEPCNPQGTTVPPNGLSGDATLEVPIALQDLLLWDIKDLDGDGIDEIIASPTNESHPINGTETLTVNNVPVVYPIGGLNHPGGFDYYLPKMQTNIYHWVESPTPQLILIETFMEGIPYLQQSYHTGTTSASTTYLYPVRTKSDDCGVRLQLFNPHNAVANQIINVPYNPISVSSVLNLDGIITANMNIADLINVSASGNASIPTGVYVNMKGGTEVHIYPGFHAAQGSNWHAYIDGCQDITYGKSLDGLANRNPENSFSNRQTVNEASTQNSSSAKFNIYPNPNNGLFTLEYSNPQFQGNTTVLVTDMLGKQVYNAILKSEKENIDISNLGKGTYIVTIQNQNDVQVKKVIIE